MEAPAPPLPPLLRFRFCPGPGKDLVIGADDGGLETGGAGGGGMAAEEGETDKALELERNLEADVAF